MDPTLNVASKDDIWRLQNEMKTVYAVQTEHADRLSRLERRYDDDGRVKSVWGTTSSAPSVRGGTPHQDSNYNPAAEAFRNFDQDNSTSLLDSLHIEPEEEPRRGTSRANSVRFDVSALHGGQLTHTSRSSSDFFPIRTGSAFGSHPLTERSSSHKSEGRQSSAGVSTHSNAVLNGLGFDTSGPATSSSALPHHPEDLVNEHIAQPTAGLFLLGPCPSIIRCWVGARYTNDSLRYAAICTGASRSMITRELVEEAGLSDYIVATPRQSGTTGNSVQSSEPFNTEAKIQVFLPEATVRQAASSIVSASASPAPGQLPAITATMAVIESPFDTQAIQLFLGSDILRVKSADVLFSQDRLVLNDDDGNRVNVPLIRPESSATFKNLVTTHLQPAVSQPAKPTAVGQNTIPTLAPEPPRSMRSSPVHGEAKPRSRVDWSRARMGRPDTVASSSQAHSQPKDIEQPQPLAATSAVVDTNRSGDDINNAALISFAPVTPGPSDPEESWSSTWRRQPSVTSLTNSASGPAKPVLKDFSLQPPHQPATTFSSVASGAGVGRGGGSAGRGMKVLKTRRMSSTRSVSISTPTGADISPKPDLGPQGWGPPSASSTTHTPLEGPRGSFSDARTPTRPVNPIGGASAFPWMNDGGR